MTTSSQSKLSPSAPRVVVIGAGVGGLSASALLANRGCEVVLCERSNALGGKMSQVEREGKMLDVGPTVLTMPWVFESLFSELGESLRERLPLRPLDVLARHAWNDGSRLDLFCEVDQSAKAIEAFAGAREAEAYRRFITYARRIWVNAEPPFLLAQRPSLATLFGTFGLRGIGRLRAIDGMRGMATALQGFFRDPRLVQLFCRYATYSGGSPFIAPATLNLIAHVEQSGVFRIDGGMARLAAVLGELLAERRVEIRTGCAVGRVAVEDGRVRGVELESGERLTCDAVVVNADINAVTRGDLGAALAQASRGQRGARRSLSAMTLAVVAKTSGLELAYHNVFFPRVDYRHEFDDIFVHGRAPRSPAVYICAQDRDADPARPWPVGQPERLFAIINAPARGDQGGLGADTVKRLRQHALRLLEQCGLRLDVDADSPAIATSEPRAFEDRFPGSGGALYGPAPHGWDAPMRRAAARGNLAGLYFAGGSVHPGAGVPMAALSGWMAADCLLRDQRGQGLPPLPGSRHTVA